ncbi:putative MFS transporter [Hypoxylon crocopeplum]|nr:putative MFS transporter [Hypoxylon crocopeplum]
MSGLTRSTRSTGNTPSAAAATLHTAGDTFSHDKQQMASASGIGDGNPAVVARKPDETDAIEKENSNPTRPRSTDNVNVEMKEETKGSSVPNAPQFVAPDTNRPSPIIQIPVMEPLEGFRLYAIIAGVCVGAFLMSLDVFVISTAIPSITADFHDSSQISWYPAAYSLTVCAVTPLAGKIATVFPLRWVYQCNFFIFLVGSLICGLASTSPMFIAGRAIAGMGASGVASGGLTIVITVSSPKTKPLNMGIASSCFILGLILAPIIGGALTEKVTWRWCFWINLPAGALSLVAMFFFFHPPPVQRIQSITQRIRSLDLVGCVMFIPAIFMVLLALQWGGAQESWNSATIIGLLVGSFVLLLIFVAWEIRKGDEAMIPGIVVGRRTVALSTLFSFCYMGCLSIATYYLPEWFQAVQGASPLESGVRILPTVISQILGTMITGGLAPRIKYYNPWLFIGSPLMCIAGGLYTHLTAFDTPTSQWIGFQIIQGFGVGFCMQIPSLIIQLALKDQPNLVPIGISLAIFVQYLGVSVIQVIGGTIFNTFLNQELTQVGLSPSQKRLLLQGGTRNVRNVTMEYFPELFVPVLNSYNYAITRTFFVPVIAAGCAFFLAFGIEWDKIEGLKSNHESDPEAGVHGPIQDGAELQPSQRDHD